MPKTHDYTKLISSKNFMIEVSEDGLKADIISQGKIKKGDYIIISKCEYYQVVDIEYYSSPSDMWRAQLTRVRRYVVEPITKDEDISVLTPAFSWITFFINKIWINRKLN